MKRSSKTIYISGSQWQPRHIEKDYKKKADAPGKEQPHSGWRKIKNLLRLPRRKACL